MFANVTFLLVLNIRDFMNNTTFSFHCRIRSSIKEGSELYHKILGDDIKLTN